jgi:hypothetical protein
MSLFSVAGLAFTFVLVLALLVLFVMGKPTPKADVAQPAIILTYEPPEGPAPAA